MDLPRATPTLPHLAWRWPFTARAAIREIVATHELELMVADTAIHAVGVWRLCTPARRAAVHPNSRIGRDLRLFESAVGLSASRLLQMPCI